MSMRATPTWNVPSVAPGTRKGKTNAKSMTKLRVRLNTGQSSANPQTCQAFGGVIARTRLARMVGMARCAVPGRVLAGGTHNRAALAFEGVAPLHAARTSQRDVPTMLTTYDRSVRLSTPTENAMAKQM